MQPLYCARDAYLRVEERRYVGDRRKCNVSENGAAGCRIRLWASSQWPYGRIFPANIKNYPVATIVVSEALVSLNLLLTSQQSNMSSGTEAASPIHDQPSRRGPELQLSSYHQPHSSKLVRFYVHPWTQILLISAICFCLPGVSDLCLLASVAIPIFILYC